MHIVLRVSRSKIAEILSKFLCLGSFDVLC
jgi:hypothetical protein